MRQAMLEALDGNRDFTYSDDCNKLMMYNIDVFTYENSTEDILLLRSDLQVLASSLSALRQRLLTGDSAATNFDSLGDDIKRLTPVISLDDSDEEDDDCELSKETLDFKSKKQSKAAKYVSSRKSKKKKRKQNDAFGEAPRKTQFSVHGESEKQRQKVKKDRSAKASKTRAIAGKLVSGEVKSQLEPRKDQKRLLGQYALSVRQSKDDIRRRAVYKMVQGTHVASRSLSYGDPRKDKHAPSASVAGILIDRAVPLPPAKGLDCDRFRESPLRIAIGTSKEQLREIAQDILSNLDRYELLSDEYEVDKMVFGPGRHSLEKMMKHKCPSLSVEQMKENADAMADTKSIVKTPAKVVTSSNIENVKVDW